MATRISNLALINKCKQFVAENRNDKSMDALIRTALISADRELREVDQFSPLAWDIHPFQGLRTKVHAEISAITAADPAVFTAESVDSDIDSHGFADNGSTHQDIVLLDGVAGAEGENNIKGINKQFYLLEYVSSTTFTLKTLGGLDALDTSGMTAYSDGGYVYHAGLILDTDIILANVSGSAWDFKRIIDNVNFDGYPTDPVSEDEVRNNQAWLSSSSAQRPKGFRYWRNMASTTSSSHYLFWYPVCNQTYNLSFNYVKEIPDISTFNTSTYPFHPADVHETIWHGALSILAGMSKRHVRMGAQNISSKIEVLFAEVWKLQWEKDKKWVRRFSRKMLGASGGSEGFHA